MDEDRPKEIGGGQDILGHQTPRPVVAPVAPHAQPRISAEQLDRGRGMVA
jgi:hypothetical protein